MRKTPYSILAEFVGERNIMLQGVNRKEKKVYFGFPLLKEKSIPFHDPRYRPILPDHWSFNRTVSKIEFDEFLKLDLSKISIYNILKDKYPEEFI